MRTKLALVVATASAGACCLASPEVRACTSFLASHAGQPVMGKNYDWDEGAGLVTINPRGLQKRALTLSSADAPATWTSKYGSLTFNQYGVEMPNGGLNEKGLVIEILWLDPTQYPPADGRPTVNELQWIQRGLDLFGTVDELARDAPTIRVSQVYARVHYLACDAQTDCAAVEYLDGQLVLTRAANMPARTLTNDTYADSADALAGFTGFGGTGEMPLSSSSLDRFVRASMLARATDGTTIPESAFTILDRVATPITVWSIVYAARDRAAYFRTAAMPKVKSVSLSDFSLACGARQVLDIGMDATGDVGAMFVNYSQTANRELLMRSTASIATQLPVGVIDQFAAYPDTLRCSTASADPPEGGNARTPVVDGGVAAQSSGGCSCSLGADHARSRASLSGLLPILAAVLRRRAGRS